MDPKNSALTFIAYDSLVTQSISMDCKHGLINTPDRSQSKTLILSMKVDKKMLEKKSF